MPSRKDTQRRGRGRGVYNSPENAEMAGGSRIPLLDNERRAEQIELENSANSTEAEDEDQDSTERHTLLAAKTSRRRSRRMDSKKNDNSVIEASPDNGGEGAQSPSAAIITDPKDRPWWSRERFLGAVLFNAGTFLLPAVYGTLSKLWIAQIDGSMVATTDVYTYIGVFAEVLNEGLPRISPLVIGDKSSLPITKRIQLTNTLLSVQTILGLIMSIVFASSAAKFADTFVPDGTREASLTYIRISAWSALTAAVETAVSAGTRALDRPDVPLVISMVKVVLMIIFDMLFLSTFRVTGNPTVNTQAVIRLACDIGAVIAGLSFYFWESGRMLRRAAETATPIDGEQMRKRDTKPSWSALIMLAKPGVYTFLESAFRNTIYLWLISGVVAMGNTYATAWGVFNTIRWGLIMVPVMALDASASTFVGHYWGGWRRKVSLEGRGIVAGKENILKPKATNAELLAVTRPALFSAGLILSLEVPLFLILTFTPAIKSFAYYLSSSVPVSQVTANMWRTIDWCYIFYAVSTQLSTILIATKPQIYWWKSFVSVLFWDLPWAIAVSRIGIEEDTAWKWHAIVFGGALVWSSSVTAVVVAGWWWGLRHGKLSIGMVKLGE